jgi:SAM-dependent methyltransferase
MTGDTGGPPAAPVYDRIGRGYHVHRRPDPRWQVAVDAALAGAATVLNVGAGAGSYEPATLATVAVEPSGEMIRQRPPGAAPAVQAVAESLPVADGAVDAVLAVLTTHHWTDPDRGYAELRRVASRQVVLTWDPDLTAGFWLVADYLPEIARHEAGLATLGATRAALPDAAVHVLAVPADMTDGVLGAYWARPEAYLDPSVRAGISALSLLAPAIVERAMARLARDLETGAWHDRYASLAGRAELDLGYRLVVAGAPPR